MKKKCPCHGCDRRTVTCHGVCREYQEWKTEREKVNQWLNDQKPIASERLKRSEAEKIRKKARGWKRGGTANG